MIAAVRSRDRAATESGSRQKVARSMSAKTGVAPAITTALAVAAKENDGTMTSSPGADAGAEQPEVQRARPGVHRDAVAAADELRELGLERRDLGTLDDPTDSSTRITASRSAAPNDTTVAGTVEAIH